MANGFHGFTVELDYGSFDNINRIKFGLAQPADEGTIDFDELSDWTHFETTWLADVVDALRALMCSSEYIFGYRVDFQQPDAPSNAKMIYMQGSVSSDPLPRNCFMVLRQQGFRTGAPRPLVTSALRLSGVPETQVNMGTIDTTWLNPLATALSDALMTPFVTANEERNYNLAIVKIGTDHLYPEPLMVDLVTISTLLGSDKRRNVWFHKQKAPVP